MADDIVSINLNNDLVTDSSGSTARVNGTIQVDYTSSSYSGNYTIAGSGLNANGSLSNSGGLINNNGSYTLGDNNLSLTYSGEQPSSTSALSYSTNGVAIGGTTFPGDTYSATSQPITSTPACYVSGSLIRTSVGEIAVEKLAIGNLVVTASGAQRPIKWIGNRSYAGRFANSNPAVLPVCFKAGSLDNGVPARDLWVSPKHAMFLDRLLIPAEFLVNGVTIIKASRCETVTYWHVELDSHDVLIAEGAPSESFIDDNSRGMFMNAHEFAALYPDAGNPEAVYCAPRVENGYALEKLRARLSQRAGIACADHGAVEGAFTTGNGTVHGWARNASYPTASVCVDILVDGALVAQTVANRTVSTFDVGPHAFEARLPKGLGLSVEVRRSLDGEAILAVDALTMAA